MKNDIQLCEHFKLSEFTRSATATARKIDNTPSQEVISNLKALCQNVLEPLRAFINSTTPPNTSGAPKELCSNGERKNDKALHFDASKSDSGVHSDEERGAVPIIISSGYRSPALNKAVGGVKNSQHMTGEAADIRLPRTPYVDWGDNLAHTDMSVAYRWLGFLERHTDFDQLILEHSHGEYWIHVSCKRDRTENRHQVLYLTKSK